MKNFFDWFLESYDSEYWIYRHIWISEHGKESWDAKEDDIKDRYDLYCQGVLEGP